MSCTQDALGCACSFSDICCFFREQVIGLPPSLHDLEDWWFFVGVFLPLGFYSAPQPNQGRGVASRRGSWEHSMAACGSVIASPESFEISSCYSGSSPTKDKEESLSKYLSTSGSKFVWLGSFQDLISFAVQHLDLNLENSKVSENDNGKAIKANHLILNFCESTGTLQVQGPQATTYKAILNDLTIGADERNLNSRHLVNTNNMNDDQTGGYFLQVTFHRSKYRSSCYR